MLCKLGLLVVAGTDVVMGMVVSLLNGGVVRSYCMIFCSGIALWWFGDSSGSNSSCSSSFGLAFLRGLNMCSLLDRWNAEEQRPFFGAYVDIREMAEGEYTWSECLCLHEHC